MAPSPGRILSILDSARRRREITRAESRFMSIVLMIALVLLSAVAIGVAVANISPV